jgi:N-methylhydantoinase B
MACDQGSSNNMLIAGIDPRTEERYVLYEYPEGGWGGNRDRDGLSAVFSIAGNTWNIPVEAVERRFPVRVECYELCADSGGAGTHRGGLGVRRDYRILGHDAELSIVGNRVLVPPWGLDGGGEGGTADYLLDADTDAARPAAPRLRSKGTMIRVEPEQLVTQISAGGGGWGDPSARDPQRVADDVRLGYVSSGAARDLYKVALALDGTVDAEATRLARAGQVAS